MTTIFVCGPDRDPVLVDYDDLDPHGDGPNYLALAAYELVGEKAPAPTLSPPRAASL